MAANPHLPLISGSIHGQYHFYHAEAYILSGEIEHPIIQPIQPYGRVVLEQTRRESLISQLVGEINIEGLISFQRGHTRVAGTHIREKTDLFGNDRAGWFTLSTAAIQGYNVVDTITADTVVAQISTEHPLTDGDVPRVNFIGTRFENLAIGGYKVEVELDLSVCGQKPDGDRHYLRDRDFLDRVHSQLEDFADADDLPESLEILYAAQIDHIDDLKRRAKDDPNNEDGEQYPKLNFSLVEEIKPIKGIPPGVRIFGNHIFIPNFGIVSLAEVEVGISKAQSNVPRVVGDSPRSQPSGGNYFNLNMLSMHLGSPTVGTLNGPATKANGQKGPP
jgi:hypothetical protein